MANEKCSFQIMSHIRFAFKVHEVEKKSEAISLTSEGRV